MGIRLVESNGGRVLEVRVTDKLTPQDYQRFMPEFDSLVKQFGKISMLFEMVNFHGWDGTFWEDLGFHLKHFSDIERLAMVGDKKWEKVMTVFCKPFTTASVRYFDSGNIEAARSWLGAFCNDSK
jgi:hypothetical protein